MDPTGLLQALLLAVHLLLANLAAAGPLLCMLYEWREGRGHVAAGVVGRRLASWALLALLAAAASGLLVGWLGWSGPLRDALSRLERKVAFGVWEVLFSLVLMAVHVAWWRGAPARGRWARQLVLLLAGTNLLYHFPTLFAVVGYLRHVPGAGESLGEKLSAADFRQLLAEPLVLAEALHVTLASFAVAGVAAIWLASRATDAVDEPSLDREAAWGARAALAATLLQVPSGIWLTVTWPRTQLQRLMGADPLASAAFALSLLLVLALLHHLASVAFAADSRKSRKAAIALTAAVVALMSVSLTLSRG